MPRALAMMVGIPLVGRLYNYVQPRILVIIGVVLVALSAYVMSRYTLDTSASSVVAAIMLQGFGFASLFVPLTTVALAQHPALPLTDATGLNSLLAPDRRLARAGGVRDAAAALHRRPRAPAWSRTSSPGGPR